MTACMIVCIRLAFLSDQPSSQASLEKKGWIISEHLKEPLVEAIRSSLMKTLDRSVEELGL